MVRELELMTAVSHPSIVSMIEAFVSESGCLTLALELCEGPDLQYVLDVRGAFSEQEAAGLFRELVSALAYLHERGVVHRDLKPANLVMVKQLEHNWREPAALVGVSVKLLDFGLARWLRSSLTASGGGHGGDSVRDATKSFSFFRSTRSITARQSCGSSEYGARGTSTHGGTPRRTPEASVRGGVFFFLRSPSRRQKMGNHTVHGATNYTAFAGEAGSKGRRSSALAPKQSESKSVHDFRRTRSEGAHVRPPPRPVPTSPKPGSAGRVALGGGGSERDASGKSWSSTRTISMSPVGTRLYSAPELLQPGYSASARDSLKVDIYSTGCILRYMLTGLYPPAPRPPIPPQRCPATKTAGHARHVWQLSHPYYPPRNTSPPTPAGLPPDVTYYQHLESRGIITPLLGMAARRLQGIRGRKTRPRRERFITDPTKLSAACQKLMDSMLQSEACARPTPNAILQDSWLEKSESWAVQRA